MSAELIPIPVGLAPGVSTRWQEFYASGAEFGTAAPRLRDLARAELREGPLFGLDAFIDRLRTRHHQLGADESSLASIDALASGAACVITGQQPHLLTGPFYTAWKILGTVALARRLTELHGRTVVPVYWCGSDDSDFAEVSSAWLFDPDRGPWRLHIPSAGVEDGAQVGELGRGTIAALEEAALVNLRGPGVEWFRMQLASIPDTGLADRAAAWVLRLFAGSGLVVVDARDDLLLSEARPLLERYAARRAEIADAVAERARQREEAGWPAALDPAARASGLFALREGHRTKIGPDDLDSGAALRWSWGPSVLLRPVVQDALLAPVAAVLGPGELAYHAELAPAYERLGVDAARPVPRPHVTLVGESWRWPEDDPEALRRVLAGGAPAAAELARLQLPDGVRAHFESFSTDLENALRGLESGLGRDLEARVRARFAREARRLRAAEADRRGGHVHRDAEWLARGRTPQERLYSCWHLWAWCAEPGSTVLDPVADAWLEAVDRAGPVQWALRMGEIR